MNNQDVSSETVWNPLKFFQCMDDYKFAVVVLNQPILLHHDQVLPLWDKAKVTVTVDGGTNQWMDYLGDRANDVLTGQCKSYLPKIIAGDMDSILPDLLDKLKSMNANIIYTPDSLETDYTKALVQLGLYVEKNNIKLDAVHVFAETAGRLDQIVSNINTLYKCNNFLHNIPVIQIASESFTWLLSTGQHKIIIPEILVKSKSWCALIPFGNSNNCVSTTGLKWNLNKTCMKFGELLSTSNTYNGEPEVTVETNVPLIWTMGIEQLTKINDWHG